MRHKIRLSTGGFWRLRFLSSSGSYNDVTLGNGIKMINVKKAVFVFCAAVGFAGALGSASAQPTRQACMQALFDCNDGVMSQCTVVSRSCGVYGIYL